MEDKVKECRRCKEVKPLDQFNWRVKGKSHQPYCKPCQSEYTKSHYRRNKEPYLARSRERTPRITKENQRWVTQYLETHPCVDCGEKDRIVLEFDHVRDVKAGNISTMCYGSGLNKVKEEVAKCEVRCANCHRRRTAKQFGWKYGLV